MGQTTCHSPVNALPPILRGMTAAIATITLNRPGNDRYSDTLGGELLLRPEFATFSNKKTAKKFKNRRKIGDFLLTNAFKCDIIKR